MNSELAYIQSQTHRQDLLRAARAEHRFEAARSRRADSGRSPRKVRLTGAWRALAFHRPAVGKV